MMAFVSSKVLRLGEGEKDEPAIDIGDGIEKSALLLFSIWSAAAHCRLTLCILLVTLPVMWKGFTLITKMCI